MGLFDTVKCQYPLPSPLHQDLEFQTKDLERLLDHYSITRDGRLIRHHRPGGRGPERDIEWPIHGDIRIYERDPQNQDRLVEYVVRFTHGRVEWIRRSDERSAPAAYKPAATAPTPVAPAGLTPEAWGRRLTVDEFAANVPDKLELIDGGIPGSDELLLLLLTSLGLRRAAMLVGPDRWKQALVNDGPAKT